MKQLTVTEPKSTFQLMRSSLRENGQIHALFGRRIRGWRFNLLIRQCVRYIRSRNGTVILNEGKGLAVVVPISSEKDQHHPIHWWQSMILIKLKRIGAVSRFHRRVRACMPAEPHLSLVLLMPEEKRNGMSAVIGLRDELFKLSEIMQLPVYAQTSSERTRQLFESFGFKTYGRVPIPRKDAYVYFLKRTALSDEK
jgi:hypothetical protein